MVALPRLRVDVSELLERPGASRSFREHLDVPANGACPAASVDAELELSSMLDGLSVHGTISGHAQAACSRCLEPVTVPLELEVREAFLEPGEETEEDEAYPLEGSVADLEPLVRDTLALNLPSYPVCRDDCAGLCPSCGTPQATGCSCETTTGDPRFAALADLQIRSDDARPEA